jgi:putative SOS response-associated peptidase YedK
MCGHYRRTTQEEELARLYHIPIPSQSIGHGTQVSVKASHLCVNQWGLIPYWVKDPKIAYRTVNARAETVDKAPSFRQAFRKRRCLIPADGFYEWRKTAKPKLPFAIAMKGGRPFTFAGLWENWRDPVHDQASGTLLPGSESGACVALPCSPRSPPLAPPTPRLVAQVCSPASSLL